MQEAAARDERPYDILQCASPSLEKWIASTPYDGPFRRSKLSELADRAREEGKGLWIALAVSAEDPLLSSLPFAGVSHPYPSMTEITCEVALRLGGHSPPCAFY